MPIHLRSRREIDLIRRAGAVVAEALAAASEACRPGVTTAELDAIAEEVILRRGGEALFKGVKNPGAKFDFPASTCISINEQVVHGIPGNRRIVEGDIVSIDCGVRLDGYCGDAAVTVCVGNVAKPTRRLVDATRELLAIAISNMRPGVRWSEIASMMEAHAKAEGFSVVQDFVGHGIGRQMHEEPKVPNFVSRELLHNDIVLRRGMVLAVEPMVNQGKRYVRVLEDGWTVVTRDGRPSAHFEHTIAVTDDGAEVLTEGSWARRSGADCWS